MKKRLLVILISGLAFSPTALAGQMSFKQSVHRISSAGIPGCVSFESASRTNKKSDRNVASSAVLKSGKKAGQIR